MSIFKITGFPKEKGRGWPCIMFAALDHESARCIAQELLKLTKGELELTSITLA